MRDKCKDGLFNISIGVIAGLVPYKFTACVVFLTFVCVGISQFVKGLKVTSEG